MPKYAYLSFHINYVIEREKQTNLLLLLNFKSSNFSISYNAKSYMIEIHLPYGVSKNRIIFCC
jgi:hypothetical protein